MLSQVSNLVSPIDEQYKSVKKLVAESVLGRIEKLEETMEKVGGKLDGYMESKRDFEQSKENYEICYHTISQFKEKHQSWILENQANIKKNRN